MAPDELAYTDPQAWQDIYTNKAALKDPDFYGKNFNGVEEILSADNANHARFRRSFAPAFSERSVKEQEPLITGYVDTMVQNLGAQEGRPVDMLRQLSLATFDIIGDLTFGESFGLLKSSKYHYWVDTTWAVVKAFSITRFTHWYPWAAPLALLVIPRGLIKQVKDNIKQSTERVNRRLASKSSRPDIWGLVLSQKGERQLSVPEMHANSQTLLLAGADTTATTLSGLFYFLAKNRETQEKLATEVRSAFATDKDINLTELKPLRYLYACIEEALRVVHPAPTGLPRIVPAGGMTICGEFVPAKTIVSVSTLATLRSPRNFKYPGSFIPERWLGDPEFDCDIKSASQPFMVGHRNCVGQILAKHELRLITAKVIWNFDIHLCPESNNWLSELKVYGVWDKKPLMMTTKRRQ
ncbi:hypothetical protein FQN49_005719 [Arthroderma sp. PD_2]|nr:hypothetical protein FQN49_005719 [Arthroderma sp. PD_2]